MVRRHEEDVDVKDESAEDAEVETKPRKRKPQTRMIHDEGETEGTVTAVGTLELDPDEESPSMMGQMLQLYEDSLKDLEEGEIVRGRVLKIDDKEGESLTGWDEFFFGYNRMTSVLRSGELYKYPLFVRRLLKTVNQKLPAMTFRDFPGRPPSRSAVRCRGSPTAGARSGAFGPPGICSCRSKRDQAAPSSFMASRCTRG